MPRTRVRQETRAAARQQIPKASPSAALSVFLLVPLGAGRAVAAFVPEL